MEVYNIFDGIKRNAMKLLMAILVESFVDAFDKGKRHWGTYVLRNFENGQYIAPSYILF